MSSKPRVSIKPEELKKKKPQIPKDDKSKEATEAPPKPEKGAEVKKTNKSILPQKLIKFEANNWIKSKNNPILKAIDKKGGGLWLAGDGDVYYRFSPDAEPIKNTVNKTSTVLSNFINQPVNLFTLGSNIGKTELKLVAEDTFNPFVRSEFIESDGVYKRNVWKPTSFMTLSKKTDKEPIAILSLIKHLCNYNDDYFEWVINWLANFFQTLKKSHTSLVLRGSQGAGKGILFTEVITPLFGKKYTIQINDKMLSTNFNGSLLEHKLFYNLDEVSHDIKSSKQVKNLIKALVTNSELTVEKKYENTSRGSPILGQILITSNEPYVLEVELSDRRYTVMMTGDSLKRCDCLGYQNTTKLVDTIRSELEAFALYLRSYEVDFELANTALDTAEKRALVHSTSDRFTLFANALKNRDMIFFDDLEEGTFLYRELKEDFQKGRVCKESLSSIYQKVNDEHISTKKLLSKLRAVEPLIFDDTKVKKSNGKRYYGI